MALEQVLKAGISGALGLPAVQKLAGDATFRVGKILWKHFTDSSHVLAEAFQNSYGCAMAAIALGLAPEAYSEKLWQRLAVRFKKLIASQVSREFSSTLQEHCLLPFARKAGLSGDFLAQFQQRVMQVCEQLSEQRKLILPREQFPEIDWAGMVNESLSSDITELLLTQTRTQFDLEPEIEAFFRYDGLIGVAVLYFVREQLRKTDRVEKTLAELQREGLRLDLKDLQTSQQQMQQVLQDQLAAIEAQLVQQQQTMMTLLQQGDFAKLAELSQQGQAVQQQRQSQQQLLEQVPGRMEEARQAWASFGGQLELFEQRFGIWCEAIADQLEAVLTGLQEISKDIAQTRKAAEEARDAAEGARQEAQSTGKKIDELDHKLAALLEIMRHLQLSPQVKARDEFTQHSTRTLELIQEALRELERLPRTRPGYPMASIIVGSALSSAGELDKAIQLLRQAYEASSNSAEKALASFNLFQLYLRQQSNQEALSALQKAIEIDGRKYALHNAQKYPIERILGVGGMGCAFLCRDRLRGQVVVKSFWEARKGPIEEVFSEVLMMARIAGQYVPQPIDYDYVDPLGQDRPYIVMEYVEGAMDGEAYLSKYGKMELLDGLQLGLQVAKGLQIAHEAGVCHLDLKPANLLLKRKDGGFEVKIIDFGLSRVGTSLKQEAVRKSRSSGGLSLLGQQIFGTLDYAPPEQLGEMRYGPPGPKSDLFSLGATLYRLLSKEYPRTINPRCLPANLALCDLLMDCLMQDPASRPASSREVVERLEAIVKDAQQGPEDRFRRYLEAHLSLGSMLERDDEVDLLVEGRALGLDRAAAQQILEKERKARQMQTRQEVDAEERRRAEEIRQQSEAEREVKRKKAEEEACQAEELTRKKAAEEAKRKEQEAEAHRQGEEEAPRNKAKPKVEWWPKILERIERQHPSWLLNQMPRNESRFESPGPTDGGCLVQLPALPAGIERKVILARDDSPLLEMVLIPQGVFLMGSTDADPYSSVRDVKTREMPQQRVEMDAYWIARTPITNRMWQKFLLESNYQPVKATQHYAGSYMDYEKNTWASPAKQDYPAVYMVYANAWAFCDFYGLMLPSEAQWEKAARGTDGRFWPWGNQFPTRQLCNFKGAGINSTTSVEAYPAGMSPYGLLDCAGNIWEWCADAWDPHWLKQVGSQKNPICLGNNPLKIAGRGGSYECAAKDIRCAWRDFHYIPERKPQFIGFRPALPAD